MNPVIASQNSFKHPFKALLAELIGKKIICGKHKDRDYILARLFGVEYLIKVRRKKSF
jgi:hypothetical protein